MEPVRQGKDIRKFLVKLLIFLLLANLPVFIYIEYFHMNFGIMEYPMWKNVKNHIDTQSQGNDPEILLMGDSTGLAGLIPRVISNNARSLCMTGATAIEDYYGLKNYLTRHKTPKTVFFGTCLAHIEQHPEFFPRAAGYKFLSLQELLSVMDKAKELGDYPFAWRPVMDNYTLESILFRANFITYYKAELLDAGFNGRRKANMDIYRAMEQNFGYLNFSPADSSSDIDANAQNAEFHYSPLIKFYLESLIDLCAKNGIRFIYQTMPLNEASYNAMHKEFSEGYSSFFSQLQAEHPGAVINNEIMEFPNNCFGDRTHLNGRGAEKMSLYLKEKYFNQ